MLSLAGEPADEDTEDKENEMPVDSKEKKRKRVNTFRSWSLPINTDHHLYLLLINNENCINTHSSANRKVL